MMLDEKQAYEAMTSFLVAYWYVAGERLTTSPDSLGRSIPAFWRTEARPIPRCGTTGSSQFPQLPGRRHSRRRLGCASVLSRDCSGPTGH